MKIKPLYIALFSSSLLFGCSSTQQGSDERVAVVTQTELALMLENARAEERSRIEQEFGVQWKQKRLFDDIRARKMQKQSLLDQRANLRIKPENDQPTYYQALNGQVYYRCAAPALNPIADSAGKWYYHDSKTELSATLCESSRDQVLMQQLQQKLFDMGYLYGDGLTQQQLLDGKWGASTLAAIQRYQEYHGLLYGELTIETLEHLAIFPTSSDNYNLLGVNSIVPLTELEKQLQNDSVKTNEASLKQESKELESVATVDTASLDSVAALAKQTKGELTKELTEKQPEAQAEIVAQSDIAITQIAHSSETLVETEEDKVSKSELNQNNAEDIAVAKNGETEALSNQADTTVLVTEVATKQAVKVDTVKQIQKIVPTSPKPEHYQTVGGAKYYRCAANALVPQVRGNGSWFSYSQSEKELAATLCKKSRDVATMTDLQYELYEKRFLTSDTLTKAELVDGFWGASTLEAVKKYQQKHGLLYGQLTIETLEHIGVFESNLQQSVEPLTLVEKPVETQQAVINKTAEEAVVAEQQVTQQAVVVSSTALTKSAEVSTVAANTNEVKPDFVVKQLQRLADDNFDLLKDQPANSKAQLMGYINGYRVWRCGARALLPEVGQTGNVQYKDQKEMRATLCKKSRTRPMIKPLQQALANKGYLKPMPGHDEVIIDGTWGDNTLEALKAFQQEKGLALGQLTIESMVALGMLKIND